MKYSIEIVEMCAVLFYTTFLGRLFDRVDLIKPVSDFRPYVRAYVRPSVHKKFLWLRIDEIWHVGRGRWVIHDGMQYDLIQGQGKGNGHEPFRVGRFQKLSTPPFTMGAGNWPGFLN